MKMNSSTLGLIALIVVMVIAMLALPGPLDQAGSSVMASQSDDQSSPGLALTNARIFDGQVVHEQATLLIRDGLVERLLTDGELPPGYDQIDIEGQTLLPGLIDAHVHSFNSARSDALRFGVTTLLDMFRPPFDFDQVHAQRESLAPTAQADLFSAGFLATVEGGHGTQYGIAVPTLSDAGEADAWVGARLAEGSDYIKIVLESGAAWGGQMPTLDAATVQALVRAAHARDAMAVAHVSTQADARLAVEAGVDGLVHVFVDEALDPALVRRIAEQDVFIIPTTTVLAGSHGQSGRDWIVAGTSLAERLSAEQNQTLEQSFPGSALRAARWPGVPMIISALHEAGVTLLAGSDAPNPATAHGASLLHELKLLHEAGLTTLEALRAATSLPAARFSLEGRGCLQPGCRADLVWIAGNPLADIDELRRVRAVWKNGVRVELETEPTDTASVVGEAADLPMNMHAQGRWLPSTDEFMGGKSTVQFEAVEDADRLLVSGRLNPGFAFPYAGVMWYLGEVIMAAVNMGQAETLELRLEAEQGSYQVMLFSGENAMAPPIRIDLIPGEKTTIDLSGYSSLDRSRLRAIGIYAIGGASEVQFAIKDASLQ